MPRLVEALNARVAAAASGRNLLLVLLAAVLVFSLFNSWLVPAFQAATHGMYPIDMVLPTTPAVVQANFAAYTDESVRIYHRFLLVDFVWPPLLALLFALLWTWLAQRCAPALPRRMIAAGLLLLPLTEALLDLLENAGFLLLLENYPAQLPAVVWATAGVRYTKLLLYGLCWLVTLMFLGLAAWSRVRSAGSPSPGAPRGTALAVAILGLLAAAVPDPAAAELSTDYCTCVVTKVYRSARDGSLTGEALPKEAAADPSFSVDLRSGAVTGRIFRPGASGGTRVWRSPDRATWLVVWSPLANSPPGALRYLRLEEQSPGTGERPISFVAASAARLFAGVCLAAPPAGIRPD